MTCTTHQTQTGSTTTSKPKVEDDSLAYHLTLIEAEITCALNHEFDDPQMTHLHLERAKHELERALYLTWHKFHTSGTGR